MHAHLKTNVLIHLATRDVQYTTSSCIRWVSVYWVNFTFDIKTNKTLCKPCGAEIAGKNTTNLKRHLQGNHPEIHAKVSTKFLLILFCQLTSVGVLLHNWNIIAQGFSKSGLRSGSGPGGNSIRTRLHLIFQAHSYHSDLRSAHTRTHGRMNQCCSDYRLLSDKAHSN